ncbi:50S ribosomal protein L24e [Candidatus Woesearchaeota archaeon]|nr:50S ribosomal protein L24e [Candidatus Woesearchaeota archaeon]
MASCNFCGKPIPTGTGKLYVQKDGKLLHFCSNKCEKNLLVLKRKPRQTRWTEEHHQVKKGVKQ